MANRARPLSLGEADRLELERLQRATGEVAGLCRRARAVLLMVEGLAGTEVAQRTGYTPVQISRIRRRFAEEGVAGLSDKPRSGRPPQLTEAKSARIVALTLRTPPSGLSHWSTRELAERVGVSHSTVHRIWKAHALQPHLTETFKFTSDPRAEEKIRDVVGLYLNPPTHAVVLSLDEKTQIQALERTQPLLPLRPGLPARQTHDYRRHGLTSLYAALEVASGAVVGECSERHAGADFLRFLKTLHHPCSGRGRAGWTSRRSGAKSLVDGRAFPSAPAGTVRAAASHRESRALPLVARLRGDRAPPGPGTGQRTFGCDVALPSANSRRARSSSGSPRRLPAVRFRGSWFRELDNTE